ncbi:hypothetical protein ADIARSV_0152 [Arcticibacter svalbardensis MN12-7]|uniref:Uncharacterized protein n=1 Tax=Arcticibacter svalbardensis MN12-7 TaxID=1150600 RepID=R9H6F2_9SPHI|nr:hypothetical protein [Arcticibacter svalbardensis]EOR96729.1 hypothetical protein ADIARSV_0152 [Arcticibacter svalbardensis MN12-7]
MKRSEKIQLISDLVSGKLSKNEAINKLPKMICIDWDVDPEDGSDWLSVFLIGSDRVTRDEFNRVADWRRKLNAN